MAHRHHKGVVCTADRENNAPNPNAFKAPPLKDLIRRPALHELSNKLDTKKQEPSHQTKIAPKVQPIKKENQKPVVKVLKNHEPKVVQECSHQPKIAPKVQPIKKENPVVKVLKNHEPKLVQESSQQPKVDPKVQPAKKENDKLTTEVQEQHPVQKIQSKKDNAQGKAYSRMQIEAATTPDTTTKFDPQLVPEYVNDIFQYQLDLETKFPVRKNFLESHKSSSRMRAVLVNWLVQVHYESGLCLETLHMCVSIVDRYLQDNPHVGGESLQLVGITALLVASKYEEVYYPDLSHMVYVCDGAFSKRQILKMEISILVGLDHNLGKPVSIYFLRQFSKIASVRHEEHNLSKYILELALLDDSFSHIRPSIQAAAACCLSMAIVHAASNPSTVWTPELAQKTKYDFSDFKKVLVQLAKILYGAEKSAYKCIYDKYSSSKFQKISTSSKLKGPLLTKLAKSVKD